MATLLKINKENFQKFREVIVEALHRKLIRPLEFKGQQLAFAEAGQIGRSTSKKQNYKIQTKKERLDKEDVKALINKPMQNGGSFPVRETKSGYNPDGFIGYKATIRMYMERKKEELKKMDPSDTNGIALLKGSIESDRKYLARPDIPE